MTQRRMISEAMKRAGADIFEARKGSNAAPWAIAHEIWYAMELERLKEGLPPMNWEAESTNL